MTDLAGRVALVTGASRGIGAAIARALAGRGAAVAVAYRTRADAADEVVHAIETAGGRARAFAIDLHDLAAIPDLFARVDAAFGGVDILVNNAGSVGAGALVDLDPAQLDAIFRVNVQAVAIASREAARRMTDGTGRIISISSLNGRIQSPGASVYAASKAAIESFTRSWAAELGARGITVNAVAPGFTGTEMLASVTPRETWAAIASMTAMGRVGRPEDIADVVAFLASDAARWVTGQIIGADGCVRAW